MSDFAPGLSDPSVRTTRAPYGSGAAGHVQSLQTIAAKIREGAVSPRVRAWAGQVLRAAGIGGRGGGNVIRAQAGAILEAFRRQVVYSSDPVGRELIQSSDVTLCLVDGLCIPVGDCDDGVVAVGSATTSVGIPTMIVKEDYPNGGQSHVLLAFRDESGEWFVGDPSTMRPIGVSLSPPGTRRTWVNPMEGASPEIIGIGSAAGPLGKPFEEVVEVIGVGDVPPTIPGAWANVPDNVVHAGLRYAVAIVSPGDWTQDDVAKFFAPDWLVETVQERTDLTALQPQNRAWVMQGLARHDAALADGRVGINAVLQEQPPPPAQQPPTPGGQSQQPPPQPPPLVGVGSGTVLLWVLGVVAAGGLGYGVYEYGKKHHLKARENPLLLGTGKRRRRRRSSR